MQEINQVDFQKVVLESNIPVLVDFNADWCGPCQIMKPTLAEFAKEHPGIKVVGINIDDNSELAEQYEVSGIPCLVLIRDGKEAGRLVGVQSKNHLTKLVEQ